MPTVSGGEAKQNALKRENRACLLAFLRFRDGKAMIADIWITPIDTALGSHMHTAHDREAFERRQHRKRCVTTPALSRTVCDLAFFRRYFYVFLNIPTPTPPCSPYRRARAQNRAHTHCHRPWCPRPTLSNPKRRVRGIVSRVRVAVPVAPTMASPALVPCRDMALLVPGPPDSIKGMIECP